VIDCHVVHPDVDYQELVQIRRMIMRCPGVEGTFMREQQSVRLAKA